MAGISSLRQKLRNRLFSCAVELCRLHEIAPESKGLTRPSWVKAEALQELIKELGGSCDVSDIEAEIDNEILKKFKDRHGEKYDYPKINAKNAKDKIEIICPSHGPFIQAIDKHSGGSGCPLCGREIVDNAKRLNTEDFVAKAREVHSGKYDYSQTVYRQNKEKVAIVCPTHGEFAQTPSNHLSGFGCYICGRELTAAAHKLNAEDFFERCSKQFGDYYQYPKRVYTNPDSIIEAVCPKHGEFQTIARNHLWIGQGCRACALKKSGEARRMTFDEFVAGAHQIHGDSYEYDKSSFSMKSEHTKIRCKKRGWYDQKPTKHLSGQGCPTCARKQQTGRWSPETLLPERRNVPAKLYYLRLQGNREKFYKIGISEDFNRRITTIDRETPYDVAVVMTIDGTLYDCMSLEREYLRKYREWSYEPEIAFPGFTECFSDDVLASDTDAK